MRCSACGKDNREGARFCAYCGSKIEEPAPAAVEPEAEAPTPEQTADEVEPEPAPAPAADPAPTPQVPGAPVPPAEVTTAMPRVEQPTEPQPATSAASDAATAAKNGAKSAVDAIRGMDKKKKLIAGGVLVLAVLALAFFIWRQGNPSNGQIKDIIRSEVSFGASAEGKPSGYEIDSIKINGKSKEPAPSEFFGYKLQSPFFEVNADVHAKSDSAEASKNVNVSIVKVQGRWQSFTTNTNSESYEPLGPVTKEFIKDNKSLILDKLYSSLPDDGKGAKMKIGKIAYNEKAKTCASTVTFTTEAPYWTETNVVKTTWEFGKEGWTVKDAKLVDDKSGVSYQKLVGTWKGKYQESTQQGTEPCGGANGKELTVKITKVDDNTKRIEGTFAGLAHMHGHVEDEQATTSGDQMSAEVPFAATLTEGQSFRIGEMFEIGIDFASPKSGPAHYELRLGFGTDEDPHTAAAVMSTTYDDDYLFYSEVDFRDFYKLEKQK